MSARLLLAAAAWIWAPVASATAHDGRFPGVKGAELGYRIYENDQATGAVVLVNGYTETYLMYDELARPLVDAGFRVYTYDHRGQGVSDRLLPAIDVGYVEAFEDYVDDLNTFIEKIVKPAESLPLDLIAHSTGGLISVHYAAAHPTVFRRMVLSAPYFELNGRGFPGWVAGALAGVACAIGRCDHFMPTQGGFSPENYPFETNHLTHSKDRFELMKTFVWGNPALLIRGPSSSFVRETMRAGEAVPALAGRIKSPVLLFQAGIDDYVLPGRQDAFCVLSNCEKVRVEGAYHELFFEAEPTRSEILKRTTAFLQRN